MKEPKEKVLNNHYFESHVPTHQDLVNAPYNTVVLSKYAAAETIGIRVPGGILYIHSHSGIQTFVPLEQQRLNWV